MRYMLDTDTCIYIQKRVRVVLDNLQSKKSQGLAISAITFAELRQGVDMSVYKEKNTIALIKFTSIVDVLPFDNYAATEYGRISATLRKLGTPIGAMDMLIAAHAKSAGLILVTNNVREFERIDNLTIENWVE